MLLWALWIASALLGWLRWGYSAFVAGGLWKLSPPPTPPAPTAPSSTGPQMLSPDDVEVIDPSREVTIIPG
jgi:hypothetical protein